MRDSLERKHVLFGSRSITNIWGICLIWRGSFWLIFGIAASFCASILPFNKAKLKASGISTVSKVGKVSTVSKVSKASKVKYISSIMASKQSQ